MNDPVDDRNISFTITERDKRALGITLDPCSFAAWKATIPFHNMSSVKCVPSPSTIQGCCLVCTPSVASACSMRWRRFYPTRPFSVPLVEGAFPSRWEEPAFSLKTSISDLRWGQLSTYPHFSAIWACPAPSV